MLDDERMSHIGNSFSAVCSPPISMMYKGRKRSSSKLKKMEVVDDNDGALDEDIWAGLLKISKSSEELWKDVYAVFSPPTPIGAKAPEYSPFDPYKPGGAAAPRGLPTLPEQPETSPGTVDTTASTAEPGKTPSNVATPFVPTVPEKTTPSTNGTITHSISIAQVPQSTGKAADSTDDRRSNRKSRDQNPFMSMAGKKPSAKSITANPFNIRSLLDREDGRSRALPPQHTPQTQLHPTDMHEPTHTPFANSMNISIPMHTSPVVPHLHPHSSHHNPTMDPMDTSGHRNHPAFESRPMNGLSHINTPHHSQPIYIHSPAPMYNIESPLLPCTEPNHNDPRNCNCNTSGHSTYTHPSNINVSGYNNTTSNANANSSNNTPTTGNNEKWTEVILYCSKLTTLASSGLANNLTFAQLTDGISLARQITTATGAAILNSSSYPPFQSTSVSDELNRLVAENLGPISTPNSQSSTVQISPHPDSSHLTPRGTTFPYYSTPPINSLPSPSITYSNSAPPSAFSSPATFSTPPYSPSSTPINSGTLPLSSWGNDGAFSTFVELRRKLPVPSPRSESGEESPDQPSSPRSPPLALSVVPLSPCLSPGGSSATVPPVSSESSVRDSKGKEPKEKEEKGTWRKPRGKKRQKYEADLECRSCGVRQTPEWRRGPFGAKTLCNACGLHWAKVLKAEGKGDQKRVALLEAKRTQFMMTQKRGTKSGIGGLPSASGNPGQIKSEPLYLSPHITQ